MPEQVDYAPIIADLERRRAELDQTIASLKRLAGLADEGASSGPSANGGTLPTGVGGGLRNDAFFGMTAPDAIKAYLAFSKRPQGAAKIADELVQHGFKTTSETPANMIRTVLRRIAKSDQVVQVKKEWGLPSWYPGLKRRAKAEGEPEGRDNEGVQATKITIGGVDLP
jgi:hypothetical protein